MVVLNGKLGGFRKFFLEEVVKGYGLVFYFFVFLEDFGFWGFC